MTKRQQIASQFCLGANDMMNIAKILQSVVPPPSIGANFRALGGALLDGGFQTAGRTIPHAAKPNAANAFAVFLRRNHDHDFSLGSTTTLALPFSYNECLVHFD